MGISFAEDDLLPGERLVATKFANMVVSVRECGLMPFRHDQLMPLVGMAGKEAIGGMVHLTNYRLIFKSHFLNRVRGKSSIFLPNVLAVSATLNNLLVDTPGRRFDFVMWSKQKFIEACNAQIKALDQGGVAALRTAILGRPEAVGPRMQQGTSEAAIAAILSGEVMPDAFLERLSSWERNDYLGILTLFQSTGHAKRA